MEHDCKFENTIMEMHGDIKCLLSEFKSMNGSLRETKFKMEKHEDDSTHYRRKIDIIWSAIHTAKWATLLLFGSGIIWKVFEVITR